MKERKPRGMEIQPEREEIEILPTDVGNLPATQATPILERAASRIEIIRPKSEFREGLNENLRGLAVWIEAQKGKLKGKTLNAIATATLVTTLISACSKPPETAPYIPTEEPRITEVIPTETPFPTETSTPLPTPTVEPSPTPTEIPMYEGNLLNVDPWAQTQKVKIETAYNEEMETKGYSFYTPYPVTLVSVWTDPETDISEEVWGFRLKDQEYRFRTSSVIYHPYPMNPEEYNPAQGPDVGTLTLGAPYKLGLTGNVEPIEGTVFWDAILSAEQNEAARILYGSLRTDPADPQRLENFFNSGLTEGFEIDENGIVDLSKVVTLYHTVPF